MHSNVSLAALSLLLCSPAIAADHALDTQEGAGEEINLTEIAREISALMREFHYDPELVADPAFLAIEGAVAKLATTSPDRESFVESFNQLWSNGPFSHVQLSVARASAEQTAAYLDNLRVGGEPVWLKYRDDVAILAVNTMMGLDTIEQIDEAFAQIAVREPRALIIDLRENAGGAFAVRPLVEHVTDEPLTVGVFVSRGWSAAHSGYPSLEQAVSVDPWQGWSIRTFWADLQTEPFLRVQFSPSTNRYRGPVYVLTSERTASAAELTSDALLATGRVTLIGERTAGEMLSQTMFDLPQGLQLALPIGDYFAFRSGRIEGAGVEPDIAVPAPQAFDRAMELINAQQ